MMRRWERAAAALILLAGGLAAAQAQEPAQDTAPAAAGNAAGDAVSALSTRTLDDLRQRPLFAPDRRAPAAPVAEPEPEPLPQPEPPADVAVEPVEPPAAFPDWTLIGVVRAGTGDRAIFRLAADGETFSMATGESRDGWTLSLVSRASVTLENAGGIAELPLGPVDQ